jgi:hypothetical protein
MGAQGQAIENCNFCARVEMADEFRLSRANKRNHI